VGGGAEVVCHAGRLEYRRGIISRRQRAAPSRVGGGLATGAPFGPVPAWRGARCAFGYLNAQRVVLPWAGAWAGAGWPRRKRGGPPATGGQRGAGRRDRHAPAEYPYARIRSPAMAREGRLYSPTFPGSGRVLHTESELWRAASTR